MSFYDPFNRIVHQSNGRIIYQTAFGTTTTIEPNNHTAADLEDARKAISRMDKTAHNWT